MPYPRLVEQRQVLLALSRALDLSWPGLVTHHRMVALLSAAIAQAIGLRDSERYDLLSAALIHDIGVSSSQQRVQILHSHEAVRQHAEVGSQRLLGAPLLAPYAETVRHHHDRWDGRTQGGLAGDRIPLQSRIIHVADEVATHITSCESVLLQTEALLHRVESRAGTHLDPELARCTSQLLTNERLLLDLTTDFMPPLLDEVMPSRGALVDMDGLLAIARVMATVIDGKSPFTHTHSKGVAEIAVRLAAKMGFSPKEQTMMRIAGLLHDVGKLAIDDSILDKPGPLSATDRRIMRQHTYFTYHIMRMVGGLEDVSEWAAFHHERLDGQGYPFHVAADEISLGARIMAVADITAALAEDRPYRPRLGEAAVIAHLERCAKEHAIDPTIVSLVVENSGELLELAAAEAPVQLEQRSA